MLPRGTTLRQLSTSCPMDKYLFRGINMSLAPQSTRVLRLDQLYRGSYVYIRGRVNMSYELRDGARKGKLAF